MESRKGKGRKVNKKYPSVGILSSEEKKKKKALKRVSKASIMLDWVYYSNYHREKEKRKKGKKKKKKKEGEKVVRVQ